MKKVLIKIISVVLVTVLSINFTFSAMAAPSRNTGNVKYLSDIVLIEAENDEKADAIFAELKKEENGGFEAKIALDLNEGGDKKVYLAYKSSTNVDDAITDIAVMNMNGDFTSGNYEQLFNETLDSYIEIANDYRVMAKEFKNNYEAKDLNAVIAHRQMNYYYLEENGEKIYMGDYLLNFPEDSTQFAKILFGGNLNIVTNLRALMSMAAGDLNTSLKDRIIASYASAVTDPSVYENAAYDEGAKAIKKQVDDMKDNINNLSLEIKKIQENDELDEDEKKYVIQITQENLDIASSFYELLKEIPMNGTNLGDYIMNSPIVDYKQFFPIVAAATEAEKLLMEYNSLYTLLLYDVLEKGGEAINEILKEFEKDYEPISVYFGVQNELAKGTVGVTGEAELLSASTGKNYIEGAMEHTTADYIKMAGLSILGAAGIASLAGGVTYLAIKKSAATVAYNAIKDHAAYATSYYNERVSMLGYYMQQYTYAGNVSVADGMYGAKLNEISNQIGSASKEMEIANAKLNAASSSLTGGQIALGSFLITAGVVMMGISIWQLVEIANKYDIDYTDIPDNMVSVVTDETNGDRFVNYKNVPSYYYDGNTIKTRENDINAYDGNQWVSMYYTKNYEAGYCLTTTADLIATETVRSGYSAIHLFSHKSNYNLNSYCNRNGAAPVYLSFKYSTNQKSAVTEVPDVVGSSFNGGLIAISGFSGLVIGLATMAIIKKKKVNDNNEDRNDK